MRRRYPLLSGSCLFDALGRPRPARATHAPPGSSRKVEVLAQRAARGEQLFHPLDAAGDEPNHDEDDAELEQPRRPCADQRGRQRLPKVRRLALPDDEGGG